MMDFLRALFGPEQGLLVAGVFLLVGMMDIAMFEFILKPLILRQNRPESVKQLPIIKAALYIAATFLMVAGGTGILVHQNII